MKIAAITNFLNTKSGAQLAFLNMMSSLRRRGCNVDIYCLYISNEIYTEIKDEFYITSLGFKERKIPFIDDIIAFWKYKKISKEINKKGCDVAFINHYRYSVFILPLLKIPKVYYCYEPPRIFFEPIVSKERKILKVATFYRKYLDRYCVKHADLILSPSYYSREYVWKVYGVFSITNPLGVDMKRYRNIEAVKKENVVLSVGVLLPHKAHEFAIRSISLIPKEKRPKLIIVAASGSEGEKKRLYELAKKLGVNLEIKGYVPDEEFVKLHNKAKVVVIPFIMEPSVEPVALACETPIVAVREGGARETIIHNETGILTNRDEKEFAKAIGYLFDNPEIAQSMGKKGREWIKENFTWEICGENLERNLNKVIKRRYI